MPLPLFHVDAFAQRPFEGNPAAIVPLDAWLAEGTMQAIAAENNLAETAFFVPEGAGFALRWFTPTVEVDLCGHATLATAHVLFAHLGYGGEAIAFATRSGTLTVRRGDGGWLEMDFPARPSKPMAAPAELGALLGRRPRMVMTGANLIAVFDTAADVAGLTPAFTPLADFLRPRNQILIATATADAASEGDMAGVDVVARVFAPAHGIPEDPVTGSAYCDIAPFWARKLKKDALVARQISPRGGTVRCAVKGDRVIIEGQCTDYLTGEIRVDG